MQTAALPLVSDLVLIGGGHAHALILRMWGMKPLPGVRLTVLNPGPVAPYTGMLPGHVAGHYSRTEMMIDLVRLARFAGARMILSQATGLDRAARLIHLQGRPPLRYDIAALDIGITSDLPDLPGFAEHATAAKPLGPYAAAWEAFLRRRPAAPRITVIGGGVGGVELAMASAHRLRALGTTPQVTVLEREGTALPGLGRTTRDSLLRAAGALGVVLRTGATVVGIGPDTVTLAGGEVLPSDFLLSVAGARPQGWLAGTGLALTDGFVNIDGHLQSSDPAIFAAGDCAHMSAAPRPKAGVFAVRQAPVLHHNLRAALSGGAMRTFRPQRDYLKLISIGGKAAIADRSGLRAGGAWLWRWKDRIDRRFMDRLTDLPAMPAPSLPSPAATGLADAMGARPLCGGCGAKVGPGALGAVLATLAPPRRAEVRSGPGDDAALLAQPGGGMQVITTDHLRAFCADPRLMSRIAAVHAMGDVWAMGATPQIALAQLILPRLGQALQADMLAEVMAAATEVFAAAGADVVGGHTSVGAELTLGFTVTGTCERPITKAGARPGDVLILTRALGSGTILAAEMALVPTPGFLLGEALAGCLEVMQRPVGPAAAILSPKALAMTDVTGFGLAGHLVEMLDASGCAATVSLATLPLMPGAEALAGLGQASSLAPANRAALTGRITLPPDKSARADLLFDPQTAGGLLAAVPARDASALLAALHTGGDPDARIIGHCAEGPPHLTVTVQCGLASV